MFHMFKFQLYPVIKCLNKNLGLSSVKTFLDNSVTMVTGNLAISIILMGKNREFISHSDLFKGMVTQFVLVSHMHFLQQWAVPGHSTERRITELLATVGCVF